MSNETSKHIMYWLGNLTRELQVNTLDLVDNILYSGDAIDDNLINEMLEQCVKIQAYLEKLKEGNYNE